MIRTWWQAPRQARLAILSVVVAGLAALAGCGDDSAGPTDYDSIDPIVFSQHVQAAFSQSCNTAGCHNAGDKAAGLDLTSYTTLSAGSDYGAMVVPYKPDLSHLYLHLTGAIEPQMPQDRDPLPDDLQRLFRRWIETGAANDDGTAMYSSVSRKGFVACQGENAVAVLDMDTGLVARVFDVDQPHSVYVDEGSRLVYISRLVTANDNVRVYDADTYDLVASGRAGSFPALMEITPDGSQLWITNFTGPGDPDHAVRILDPSTLQEIVAGGLTPSGNTRQPHGLAIAPSGDRVYVTNIQSDNISVFTQGSSPGVDAIVALPPVAGTVQQPQQCVLSPNEDYLYVSALGSDKVHVMRTSNYTFAATIDVGDAPWHLTLSPDGTRLWVANWVGESITVIDVASPESPVVLEPALAPPHPVSGHQHPAIERPIGIAFTPDGTQVWVANANDDLGGAGHHPPPEGEKPPGSIAIFDATTRQLIEVAEVPNFARFVSFLP